MGIDLEVASGFARVRTARLACGYPRTVGKLSGSHEVSAPTLVQNTALAAKQPRPVPVRTAAPAILMNCNFFPLVTWLPSRIDRLVGSDANALRALHTSEEPNAEPLKVTRMSHDCHHPRLHNGALSAKYLLAEGTVGRSQAPLGSVQWDTAVELARPSRSTQSWA